MRARLLIDRHPGARGDDRYDRGGRYHRAHRVAAEEAGGGGHDTRADADRVAGLELAALLAQTTRREGKRRGEGGAWPLGGRGGVGLLAALVLSGTDRPEEIRERDDRSQRTRLSEAQRPTQRGSGRAEWRRTTASLVPASPLPLLWRRCRLKEGESWLGNCGKLWQPAASMGWDSAALHLRQRCVHCAALCCADEAATGVDGLMQQPIEYHRAAVPDAPIPNAFRGTCTERFLSERFVPSHLRSP